MRDIDLLPLVVPGWRALHVRGSVIQKHDTPHVSPGATRASIATTITRFLVDVKDDIFRKRRHGN